MKIRLIEGLSLRAKAFAVTLICVSLIAGLIGTAAYLMHVMRDSAETAYEGSVNGLYQASRLRQGIEAARMETVALLHEKGDKEREGRIARVGAQTETVSGIIAQMQGSETIEAGPVERLGRLKELWSKLNETRDSVIIPALRVGETDRAAQAVFGGQEARYNEIIRYAEAIEAEKKAAIGGSRAYIDKAYKNGIMIFAVMTAVGAAVAAIVIYSIGGEITRRFGALMDTFERFNKGERDVTFESGRKDELGRLAETLNWMIADITENALLHEQYVRIINWEAQENERRAQELARSEGRLRGLIETTNDWVWEVDSECRYTYASPRVREILGYEPEDIIGKTPFELMTPEEATRVKEAFGPVLAKKNSFTNLVNANLRKDGTTVVLESSGKPFFNESGALLGYRGIDRDITLRKKTEEDNEKMRVQLVQSDKLASIGQLAAGVAHEINNPVGFVSSNLNALTGYIETLQELDSMNERLVEAARQGAFQGHSGIIEITGLIKEIEAFRAASDIRFTLKDSADLVAESKDGLQRIQSIVKGLKEFSHSAEAEMVRSDVNTCLEAAVKLGWHEIKYKAEVVKELGAVPLISCKPQQLTQVFLNMLVNASQAIEEKGSILVRSRLDGEEVKIEISDTGCGIPEDVIKRIFDPFFTTKPVGKGTGLGLSIAYGIISEHGGRIDIASEPGIGTCVTIFLPTGCEGIAAA